MWPQWRSAALLACLLTRYVYPCMRKIHHLHTALCKHAHADMNRHLPCPSPSISVLTVRWLIHVISLKCKRTASLWPAMPGLEATEDRCCRTFILHTASLWPTMPARHADACSRSVQSRSHTSSRSWRLRRNAMVPPEGRCRSFMPTMCACGAHHLSAWGCAASALVSSRAAVAQPRRSTDPHKPAGWPPPACTSSLASAAHAHARTRATRGGRRHVRTCASPRSAPT